eukprot:365519-Chlamydomonas_euryale.AAC.5
MSAACVDMQHCSSDLGNLRLACLVMAVWLLVAGYVCRERRCGHSESWVTRSRHQFGSMCEPKQSNSREPARLTVTHVDIDQSTNRLCPVHHLARHASDQN